MSMPALAFYCVTGRDYFPGAVAMVNSLRLQGHREPVFVLDAGMEPEQAERLGAEARIVPAPRGAAPSLLKLIAPSAHPARAMVLLDADLIITRPLTEAIAAGEHAGIAAFENDTPRYFEAWAKLLELPPVRRGPYTTTSAIFLRHEEGMRVFELMEERQAAIDPARTWIGGGREDDPLYFHDQDVFNALVHSCFPPERLAVLDGRLAPIPPFTGVRIDDRRTLRCALRGGGSPLVLHHCFRKPWLVRMRSNVYSRLLPRLLFSEDVAIRLPADALPRRLRDEPVAVAERLATDAALGVPGLLRRFRRPAKVTAWPERGA